MKPHNPDTATGQDQEPVAPHRAAQRLYDEMAHAYHEQSDLDREVALAFAAASLETVPPDDEE